MPARLVPYLIALAVFGLDRFTKHVIETRMSVWDTIPVIPGVFNIVHAQNRGAAFGILSDAEHPLRTFFLVGLSLMVLVVIAGMLWKPARVGLAGNRLLMAGLSLVLGGALGNVHDRILAGSVTDFLQVFIGSYEFPSFNVADSAITVGAGLLMLDMWYSHRRQAAAENRPAG